MSKSVLSAANSLAISYPIPDEAPVINAISFILVELILMFTMTMNSTKLIRTKMINLTQMCQNQLFANFCRMRVRLCRSIPKKEER